MDLNFLNFNNFAKFFRGLTPKEDIEQEREALQNAQAVTQDEFDTQSYQTKDYSSAEVIISQIDFGQVFESKKARVQKYREMSLFPEISDALDYICDEAIVDNEDGDVSALKFKKKINKNIETKIQDLYDHLTNDILHFNEKAWEYFRKWLVESEIYFEIVMNDKKDDIVAMNILPAFTMTPVFAGNKIKAFKQKLVVNRQFQTNKEVDFAKEQIIYINYGLHGENKMDSRGYLEAAIRTYNQLKNLEDSLIVYRLVRAPEKRVWNIATGKMPKTRAEEYIQQLIRKYKKKSIYDPETGKVDSTYNVQSLTEDFWFARPDDSEGTSVTTLQSGMNLGELEDVNYFLKKLYKTLKLPKSRWEEQTGVYQSGKAGEITREEIKFSRFMDRLQNRFKYVLLDTLIVLMRINKIPEEYIDKNLYDIDFTQSNYFREFKEQELLQSRFNMLSNAYSYVYSMNNPDGFLSKQFVVKKYFKLDEEDEALNRRYLEEEKVEVEKQKQEMYGGGGFGGQGGFDQGGGYQEQPPEPGPEASPVDRLNYISTSEPQSTGTEGKPQEQEEVKPKKKPKAKMLTDEKSTRKMLDFIDSL